MPRGGGRNRPSGRGGRGKGGRGGNSHGKKKADDIVKWFFMVMKM